jgi:hypothetical protein
MEDISNVSSEEELLQLRNEGKISKDEYEELRSAMRKSTKLDVEAPTAAVDKAKSKRRLGKIAFCLMLAGIVLPAVWFSYGWVVHYRATAAERRVPVPTRIDIGPNGEEFTGANGENFAEVAYSEHRRGHRRGMGTGFWLFAPFTLIFEIAAFVMGVIAWPDVFAKATVVTISFIVVLALLFGLLTVA